MGYGLSRGSPFLARLPIVFVVVAASLFVGSHGYCCCVSAQALNSASGTSDSGSIFGGVWVVGRLEFGLTARTRLSGSLGLWLLLCTGSGVDTADLVVGSFGNWRCALLLLWVLLRFFCAAVLSTTLPLAAAAGLSVIPRPDDFAVLDAVGGQRLMYDELVDS